MKKFLGKKWAMITFIALAGVFLALTLFLALRPVSTGLAYKYSKVVDDNNRVKTTMVFGAKKVKMTSEGVAYGLPFSSEPEESYYLSKGNKVDFFALEIQYNAAKADKDHFETNGTKISAFSMGEGDEKFTCTGAIVLVTIGAVLTLAAGAFAVLSVMENKKHKK